MKKLLNVLGLIFDVTSLVIFTMLTILVSLPVVLTGQILPILVVTGIIFLSVTIMCLYETIKMAKRLWGLKI